jgi:acyl carrier protein
MLARDQLELELKHLIVTSLALEEVRPESINSTAPLFGEGLGLDSIDALEIVMALQRKYGFRASDLPEFGPKTVRSVSQIAEFIEAQGLRPNP